MYEINAKPNNIITYTKVRMSPLEPQAEEISIYDIAHALSFMCRANGHIKTFFSVAQHCINCSLEAKYRGLSERLQLALLLHDASEAYLADITRPVKHNLSRYLEIEFALQTLIYSMYGVTDLTVEECEIIDEIDNAMLHHEFLNLANEAIFTKEPEIFGKHSYDFLDFKAVEDTYIRLFTELTTKAL